MAMAMAALGLGFLIREAQTQKAHVVTVGGLHFSKYRILRVLPKLPVSTLATLGAKNRAAKMQVLP